MGGEGGTGSFFCASGGSGAGGTVRLVASHVVTEPGLRIDCRGGQSGFSGGNGRIRVEANVLDLAGGTLPEMTWSRSLAPVFRPVVSPRVSITQVDDTMGGVFPVPSDPRADLDHPTDVTLPVGGMVVVRVHAENVPLDWNMNVRTTHRRGFDAGIPQGATVFAAAYESGTFKSSIWTAQVDLANGVSALQARAFQPR
jgi:hypothetical protein